MIFFRTILFIALVFLFFSSAAFSQTGAPAKAGPAKPGAPAGNPIKSSAAYIELTLHRADTEAELLDMLVEYTEEYPKVKQLKLEVAFVQTELDNLLKLDASLLPKLTESFAKLLLQKVRMQIDLAVLRVAHKDDHPDVQRALRRVEIYEKAIKELLQ